MLLIWKGECFMAYRRKRGARESNRDCDHVNELNIHADKVVIRANKVFVEDVNGSGHGRERGESDRNKHHHDKVGGESERNNHHRDKVGGESERNNHHRDDVGGESNRRDPWSKLLF
jgi:hypothetical protein